jgi:hypothetical protein
MQTKLSESESRFSLQQKQVELSVMYQTLRKFCSLNTAESFKYSMLKWLNYVMIFIQVESCQVEIADLRKRLNQYESLVSQYNAQVQITVHIIQPYPYTVKVVKWLYIPDTAKVAFDHQFSIVVSTK